MNRTTQIQPISALSLAAQGPESCVRMGINGFEQRAPAQADVATTK